MARVARSRIIPTVLTQGISLIFLFTLGFVPYLSVAAISLLLRNVLMQSASPLLDNFSMLVSPPEEQGTIASIRGIAWQAGQTAGLVISGVVQSRYGFTPLFITTGCLYALGVFLTWYHFRPLKRKYRMASPQTDAVRFGVIADTHIPDRVKILRKESWRRSGLRIWMESCMPGMSLPGR